MWKIKLGSIQQIARRGNYNITISSNSSLIFIDITIIIIVDSFVLKSITIINKIITILNGHNNIH